VNSTRNEGRGREEGSRNVKAAADVIVKISAGQYHSLAVDAGGRLYSWGWGVHGQLGHPQSSVEDVDRPTVVGLLRRHAIADAAGGFAHSLVLTADGRVFAFGLGLFGQLGNGTTVKSTRPCQVPLPAPARLIATGYFHNLAVLEPTDKSDGSQRRLFQWGSHPQILRLEAQQRRKERILSQKSASNQKSKGSSSSLANSGPSGYCNGGPQHSLIGGQDEPLDLSFSSSKLLDISSAGAVPLDLSAAEPLDQSVPAQLMSGGGVAGSSQPESLPTCADSASELHLSPQVRSQPHTGTSTIYTVVPLNVQNF
jgi:hypothetical protein